MMLPAAAEESSNVHEDESHSVHDFEEFRGFLESENICACTQDTRQPSLENNWEPSPMTCACDS